MTVTTAATEAPTYTAMVTGAQALSLVGLARRLNQAGAPSGGRLHPDLADALTEFARLAPELSEADRMAYCRALDLGMVPDWDADDQPLTETPTEWTARARARRAAGPATWPGLLPGAGRYEMPLTACHILSFEALAARLARRDGDAPVVRHDLWAALQDFACALPEPSTADVGRYLAAVAAGELPDWNALPLTGTAVAGAESLRACREVSRGGQDGDE